MDVEEPRAGLFYHPDLMVEDPLHAGPEGGRLGLIIDQLVVDGLWGELLIEAEPAPLKRLRDIHEEEYLNDLHKRVTHGAKELDPLTPLSEKSLELARLNAGEVLDAIDGVMSGELVTAACLTGTPGHHAGFRTGGGGSLVNVAAVGAHFLTKKYRMERVAILDFDAAHGNGTQEIFWKRRDVLYLSIHEYPAWPGSGHYSDVGDSPARGYTVNVPFPSGYGDREYLLAMREIVIPVLKQYGPEFILLSWGTNILRDDRSFHLVATEAGMMSLLGEIVQTAKSLCKGRLVSILEGGTPGKAMARAVSQHVSFLLNNTVPPVDKGEKGELTSFADWYSYAKS